MLLVLTDAVGLTSKLSQETKGDGLLLRYFSTQLQAFSEIACHHARFVHSTGDGVLLAVRGDDCVKDGCGCAAQRLLHGVSRASITLREDVDVQLRSVLHSSEKVFEGLELPQVGDKDLIAGSRERLRDDLFGLELARITRIATLTRGPFHIATEDFVRYLTKGCLQSSAQRAVGPSMLDHWELQESVDRWNAQSEGGKLSSAPIPLPYLRGLELHAADETGAPSIEQPYLVWEWEPQEGQ